MNNKDLKILSNLRKNARISLTNLSKKTSIPISTLFDRLKNFENNYISKHTSLVDFNKLGYNTRAKVILKVSRENKDSLKNYLSSHENVNSLFKINNGFDFLVEVIFKHIVDLELFLEELDKKFILSHSSVYYVLEDIKREGFLEKTYGGEQNGKKTLPS